MVDVCEVAQHVRQVVLAPERMDAPAPPGSHIDIGVYVNGRRIEWSPLTDGDEITVGRHAIFFLDTAALTASSRPSPAVVAD